MYHHAMFETKNCDCPIKILRCAKTAGLDIKGVWSKEPYVLKNVTSDVTAINTILASLKSGINMGINEYLAMYPDYEGYEDEPEMIESITVDTSSMGVYHFDNVRVIQELYKICNKNMKCVKFAFDTLLAVSQMKENRQ